MPDVTDVPGSEHQSPGPTLEDIAEIVARTNRGLLALERMVFNLQTMLLFGLAYLGMMLARVIWSVGRMGATA